MYYSSHSKICYKDGQLYHLLKPSYKFYCFRQLLKLDLFLRPKRNLIIPGLSHSAFSKLHLHNTHAIYRRTFSATSPNYIKTFPFTKTYFLLHHLLLSSFLIKFIFKGLWKSQLSSLYIFLQAFFITSYSEFPWIWTKKQNGTQGQCSMLQEVIKV